MTKPAPWKRRSRKQRGIDRREAKEAKAAVLAELHAQWNAKYAKRVSTPEGRAKRRAWHRSYRARRRPKPRTEAQRLRRNELARARAAAAKAAAVSPTSGEQVAQRAKWRAAKQNQTRAQKDAANLRRRARRASLPKTPRPRFDKPFLKRMPTPPL